MVFMVFEGSSFDEKVHEMTQNLLEMWQLCSMEFSRCRDRISLVSEGYLVQKFRFSSTQSFGFSS